MGQDGREGCLLVSPLATPCLPTTPGCGSSGKLRSQDWGSKDSEDREGRAPGPCAHVPGRHASCQKIGSKWRLLERLWLELPLALLASLQPTALSLALGHSASPWLAQADRLEPEVPPLLGLICLPTAWNPQTSRGKGGRPTSWCTDGAKAMSSRGAGAGGGVTDRAKKEADELGEGREPRQRLTGCGLQKETWTEEKRGQGSSNPEEAHEKWREQRERGVKACQHVSDPHGGHQVGFSEGAEPSWSRRLGRPRGQPQRGKGRRRQKL